MFKFIASFLNFFPQAQALQTLRERLTDERYQFRTLASLAKAIGQDLYDTRRLLNSMRGEGVRPAVNNPQLWTIGPRD